MVTRRAFVVAVAIMIVLSSVLAFVAVDIYHILPRHFDHDGYYFNHLYYAKIFPATESSYSILIPIPVIPNSNTTHDTFLEKLRAGSADVALELKTTEHGIALQVSGNTSASLSWSGYWEKNFGEQYYSSLSMIEPYNTSESNSAIAFFKSIGTPVGISIDYHTVCRYGYGGTDRDFSIDAIGVDEGWHDAVVTISTGLIN